VTSLKGFDRRSAEERGTRVDRDSVFSVFRCGARQDGTCCLRDLGWDCRFLRIESVQGYAKSGTKGRHEERKSLRREAPPSSWGPLRKAAGRRSQPRSFMALMVPLHWSPAR